MITETSGVLSEKGAGLGAPFNNLLRWPWSGRRPLRRGGDTSNGERVKLLMAAPRSARTLPHPRTASPRSAAFVYARL